MFTVAGAVSLLAAAEEEAPLLLRCCVEALRWTPPDDPVVIAALFPPAFCRRLRAWKFTGIFCAGICIGKKYPVGSKHGVNESRIYGLVGDKGDGWIQPLHPATSVTGYIWFGQGMQSTIETISEQHWQDFSGKRAVITGGLGLIGSALARRLVRSGAEVTLIDNLAAEQGGNIFNINDLQDKVRVEKRDIAETGALAPFLAGADFLFNLAARTSHLGSMRNPLDDLDVNCRAQLALLETCRQVNPRINIVFAGTRQIYGRPRYLPVDEAHPLRPPDVNGVGKMAGEAYHLLYHDAYGMRVSALRLTNTYGPGMRIKDAHQTFVGIWLRRVLEGEAFELWGGEQRRDFLYVEDAVEAFLCAATNPEANGKAFNVGGSAVVTLRQLAEALIAVHGGGSFEQREFPPERKRIDIGDYFSDDSRFRAATGWAPRVSVEAGLRRSLDFFRTHLAHYV